jgi:hypothetical protein
MMASLVTRWIWTTALWAQAVVPPPKPFTPKPAPEQPIAFNHKSHAAAGLACATCHPIKAPGDLAGLPPESLCMGCHTTLKADSPQIAKLADFARDSRRVPWVRVYRLPKTIYFSHEVHHRQAKLPCADCHGPIAERDAVAQEKSIYMAACMECHDRRGASNKCDLCHDSH